LNGGRSGRSEDHELWLDGFAGGVRGGNFDFFAEASAIDWALEIEMNDIAAIVPRKSLRE
jgi:hypothetical protein